MVVASGGSGGGRQASGASVPVCAGFGAVGGTLRMGHYAPGVGCVVPSTGCGALHGDAGVWPRCGSIRPGAGCDFLCLGRGVLPPPLEVVGCGGAVSLVAPPLA